MAWGTKVHATQLTHVSTEQIFSTEVTLGLGECAHVQIKGTWPGSPSDALVVRCYGTLDASSEQWDEKPFYTFTLYSNETVASFIVKDYYKFQVGIQRSGSTDDICADMWSRTTIQL